MPTLTMTTAGHPQAEAEALGEAGRDDHAQQAEGERRAPVAGAVDGQDGEEDLDHDGQGRERRGRHGTGGRRVGAYRAGAPPGGMGGEDETPHHDGGGEGPPDGGHEGAEGEDAPADAGHQRRERRLVPGTPGLLRIGGWLPAHRHGESGVGEHCRGEPSFRA